MKDIVEKRDGSVENGRNHLQRMNIGEAKKLFLAHPEAFYADDMSLARLLQKKGLGIGLPNQTYAHALSLTHVMFNETSKDVKMLAGPECCGFLQTLSSSLNSTLERIKRNGGKFKLIVAHSEKPPYVRDMERKYAGIFEAINRIPKNGILLSHYIVCDDYMLRDELPHAVLDDEKDAELVKATVFLSMIRAKGMIKRFEATWDYLHMN